MRRRRKKASIHKRAVKLLEAIRALVMWGSVVLGLSFLGVFGLRELSKSHWLELKNIQVHTDGPVSASRILRWVQIPKGTPMLSLDVQEIRSRLERHPCIRAAAVRRVFPHTLEIRVQQRRPVAKVRLGRELLYMDDRGVLFRPCSRTTQKGLFMVVAQKPQQIKSHPRNYAALMHGASELIGLLRRHRVLRLNYIKVHPRDGLIMVFPKGPNEVFMGMRSLSLRLDRLMKIRLHLIRRGEWERVESIDLRYARRADVKFGG
jgi:cell division protein FtsQ